jgi:hypothetical protein
VAQYSTYQPPERCYGNPIVGMWWCPDKHPIGAGGSLFPRELKERENEFQWQELGHVATLYREIGSLRRELTGDGRKHDDEMDE